MSKEKDEKYFNFPIDLLKGFLIDSTKCLDEISKYALFAHADKLEQGLPRERLKSAIDFFGLVLADQEFEDFFDSCVRIYVNAPKKSVKVGINKNIFFDYKDNYKSEFDKVCLLAFLAIKSIIQTKPYCKIDNAFLWSRMDGSSKSIDVSELSDEIKTYANRYQIDKIKKELIFNWYLIYYSRHTRGFYVSFKLTLNDLVFEAEKKRKAVKEKQQKQAQNDALKQALERLNTPPP